MRDTPVTPQPIYPRPLLKCHPAIPRQATAITGAITLQLQFTMLRTVPSTVVACWP